jgi:hypothetical protein
LLVDMWSMIKQNSDPCLCQPAGWPLPSLLTLETGC